jgi:hypothetical protein
MSRLVAIGAAAADTGDHRSDMLPGADEVGLDIVGQIEIGVPGEDGHFIRCRRCRWHGYGSPDMVTYLDRRAALMPFGRGLIGLSYAQDQCLIEATPDNL